MDKLIQRRRYNLYENSKYTIPSRTKRRWARNKRMRSNSPFHTWSDSFIHDDYLSESNVFIEDDLYTFGENTHQRENDDEMNHMNDQINNFDCEKEKYKLEINQTGNEFQGSYENREQESDIFFEDNSYMFEENINRRESDDEMNQMNVEINDFDYEVENYELQTDENEAELDKSDDDSEQEIDANDFFKKTAHTNEICNEWIKYNIELNKKNKNELNELTNQDLEYDDAIGELQNIQKENFSINLLVKALLIMATKFKRNLTYTDTEIVMKLSNALNDSNAIKITKYYLKEIINQYSNFMEIHHFCIKCERYIGPEHNIEQKMEKENQKLHCYNCDLDFEINRNKDLGNVFIVLSLRYQLKKLFEKYHTKIFENMKQPRSYLISDIFDGKLYKKKFNNMVSINFCLDGIPVFKSSSFSIYPVLCTLNELPVNDRRNNIMLASLWFGPGKPKSINEFLRPFVNECKLLYETGFTYEFQKHTYVQKCRVLNCICDSIQRPIMRGSTQFNGKYGCGLCLHEGEEIEKGNGRVRVYPVIKNNFYGNGLRNHEDTLMHSKNRTKGMKYESILHEIPEFDIIHNLDVDWMHCVGLGVCRQFCDLWFHPSNHDKQFYFGSYLKQIDNVLKSYKPSLEVSRTPRAVSDRVHWKAHEWIIWLLFYSLPTLSVFFPHKYIEHWALLIEGVSILLNDSIFKSQVYRANNCLKEFVKKIEPLYGRQYISFNNHLLLHLAQSVTNWGPLWTHSAFIYEDYNQIIKSYVKSSHGVALQVCDKFRMKVAIETLQDICHDHINTKQKAYLDELFIHKKNPNSFYKIDKCVSLLGTSIKIQNARQYILALHRINVTVSKEDQIFFYKRARINEEIIHSSIYSLKKVKKRNSFTILMKNASIFEIEIFLVLKKNNSKEAFAIGYYLNISSKSIIKERNINHLKLLKKEKSSMTAIKMDQIKEKVIILKNQQLKNTVACVYPSHAELLT